MKLDISWRVFSSGLDGAIPLDFSSETIVGFGFSELSLDTGSDFGTTMPYGPSNACWAKV